MSIKDHEKDYKPEAWKNYTIAELGWWIHLLAKRSKHRNNQEKRKKDLYDASNYFWMLQQKLEEYKEE
jgi:hypothetical protein